jgi:hypothetical protein
MRLSLRFRAIAVIGAMNIAFLAGAQWHAARQIRWSADLVLKLLIRRGAGRPRRMSYVGIASP